MFQVSGSKIIKSDLPIIKDNYQVLLFDEEPIVYCGTNRFGNRVIGSLAEENQESLITRHFRVIIDEEAFVSYITQKSSYLEIFQESKDIFVLDYKFSGELITVYHLDPSDIPGEYWPLEDAYCPNQVYKPQMSYLLRLIGKLADKNTAVPRVISNIQNKFTDVLESAVDQFKSIGFKEAYVLQRPYKTGSFVLSFDVTLNEANALFLEEDKVADYLKRFLEYCIRYLPEEVEFVYGSNPEKAEMFGQLVNNYKDIYERSGKSPPGDYLQQMKDEVKKATETIAAMNENIGDNFSELEILNDSSKKNIVGLINHTLKDTIDITVQTIQDKTSITEKDKAFKQYDIYIYHLNVKTRTGNAFIHDPNDSTKMSQPKINISGEEPLEGTKYTKSLHATEWITVRAKATVVDGKIKSLEIEYEGR